MMLNWFCMTCGRTFRSRMNNVNRRCTDRSCDGQLSFHVDLRPRVRNGRRLRDALRDARRSIDWEKDPLGLTLLDQLRKDLGRG